MVYSNVASVDESNAPEALDRVFAALSHPTRRQLVRYLTTRAEAPRMSQVAQDNQLSPQLLNKHTAALEKAGVVKRVSVGRESMLVIDRAALIEAQKWIVDTRAFWEGQLDSLDAYIGTLTSRGDVPPIPPKEL